MSETSLDAIEEEAVAWFVRLHDENATDDDRAAHAQWLAADPHHGPVWLEVAQLWLGMDGLQGVDAPDVIAIQPPTAPRAVVTRRRLAAAAVAFLIGSAGWMANRSHLFADERTAVAENRSVALSDGSRVELAASSALSVDFSQAERKVVLHDGEAFFVVAKDDSRPFRVQAADGSITDIGTAFDVKLGRQAVDVAVTHGVVDVVMPNHPAVRLTPGRAVRYGANGVAAPKGIDAANIGLWREGRLAFDNAPLPEVLRDLERYRRGRIIVMDESLDRLAVSGMFDATRTDAALDTIVRTLPVRLVRITRFLVLVYPAS
ncbi:FecR family protein (plasmid) [Sphingobium sp. V4]|uniref:FecR family protein n=1 Tax=Sphingobium sp. V4 TaxID=3038927 RepID=UPI002557DEDD|nr:FecR family protein [Sphingobium sp. V4]WIW90221.1 FecR family protein [Sphingobium sp. V4]